MFVNYILFLADRLVIKGVSVRFGQVILGKGYRTPQDNTDAELSMGSAKEINQSPSNSFKFI